MKTRKGHKPLLSSKEVAAELGISMNTLCEYRAKGRLLENLHYVKINARLIKYYKYPIRHWIDNGASDPDRHMQYLRDYHNA